MTSTKRTYKKTKRPNPIRIYSRTASFTRIAGFTGTADDRETTKPRVIGIIIATIIFLTGCWFVFF